MFHIFVTIFKLNDNVYTLEDTSGQSWLYYIGPKRETPKLVQPTQCTCSFSQKVAWSGISFIGWCWRHPNVQGENPLICLGSSPAF